MDVFICLNFNLLLDKCLHCDRPGLCYQNIILIENEFVFLYFIHRILYPTLNSRNSAIVKLIALTLTPNETFL